MSVQLKKISRLDSDNIQKSFIDKLSTGTNAKLQEIQAIEWLLELHGFIYKDAVNLTAALH